MTDGTKTPIQKSDRVLRSASSRRNNPPSLTTITPSEADYNEFFYEVIQGNLAEVMRLHNERNINLNYINEEGYSALHRAVMRGHENIVRYLIDKGADLNTRDTLLGHTPLMDAVFFDRKPSLVYLLLMEGADDTIVNIYNNTAFDEAVGYNRPYAVREFWEEMKTRVPESKVLDSLMKFQSNPPPDDAFSDNTPLANFLNEVPPAMFIMENVMSYVNGTETENDPRLLNIHSIEYQRFLTGVINAFTSLPAASRVNLPFDFFMPFINELRPTPLSRERAMDIMKKVLVTRKNNHDERNFSIENPSELTLKTLTYNEETNTVSLPPDEDE